MVISNTNFIRKSGRIINAGLARTLVLNGNIQDLFPLSDKYVSLVELLIGSFYVRNKVLVVYELNGPIRFINPGDYNKVRNAWTQWRSGQTQSQLAIERIATGVKADKAEIKREQALFDNSLERAQDNPGYALEFLRQLCICSRTSLGGRPLLSEDLIVIIERADMLIPTGEISRLSEADRHRVSVCHDWFADSEFLNGDDSVIMVAESRSLINSEIAKLPQIMEVEVESPSFHDRLNFIGWFENETKKELSLWGTKGELAKFTAGLSLHALRQLLASAFHDEREISPDDVIDKVEKYIKSQVGEDTVEFKRPLHNLSDLVGFSNLKVFLKEELIPRFLATGPSALSGAAVCGPIGCGKTFIFEAVAAELGVPVLVLKNLRSKWFGETDVILERLRRAIDALMKVIIFVDEADTQFGGVGEGSHETERRLTGKIQAMMSDPQLRGKVTWLLMTARINLLSPDIRRPGRVGDLIIPVFDPEGEDRGEFIYWMLEPIMGEGEIDSDVIARVLDLTVGYSAASFASLRSELIAKHEMSSNFDTIDDVGEIIRDHLPSQIGPTRRYQTLQALLNCSRRSLLPNPDGYEEDRKGWDLELAQLEAQGIKAG